MFDIVFHEPEIPGNSGNAIRLAACTGARLHLVEPLGYDMSEAKLRRAGLDYHDLANVHRHANLDAAFAHLGVDTLGTGESETVPRVFAYTSDGDVRYDRLNYQRGDILLFGKESVGLGHEVLSDERITAKVALPMLSGRRSLNLANSAAIVSYEAWRQLGFAGAQPIDGALD